MLFFDRKYRFTALSWAIVALLYPGIIFSAPSLLKQYDEETVYAVLADEVPTLTIDSMTLLLTTGWDNVVADVNGEWIFRFPRSEEFIAILEREQCLLQRLHKHVSMPTPHYQYIGLHTAFVGYRKIIGEALSEQLYCSLTAETQQNIAASLALFLSQLHRAISVEEALQWGYREFSISLPWIEHSLLGTLPSNAIERMIGEALAYAKHHPYGLEYRVFLHNDLHGENLAFDVKTGEVSGVFDFSDAAIGDYSVEFGKLFCIHPDLAIRTCEAYASLNDVPNPLLPAAVDYILRRALYILHNRACGNVSRESSLVQMLQHFIPIWDELQKSAFINAR